MKKIDRRGFLNLVKSAGIVSIFPFGTPIFLSNVNSVNQLNSSKDNQDSLNWPKYIQEFPTIAIDEEDNLWVAVLERVDIYDKKIRVFSYRKNEIYEVAVIQPKGITGLSAPNISMFEGSIVLTFSVEKDGRWDIAYSIIDIGQENKEIKQEIITHPARINISPIVATYEDNIYILWESNEKGKRGIYSCIINKNCSTKPIRLTDTNFNSYNPAVVALPNGDIFAAWDSVRDKSADIYGAWCKNGNWQNETKLTSDSRIEKHPYLTNWKNEVWMCWEAQSYLENYSNNLTEQRITVAKINDDKLYMPKYLFECVSPDTHIDSQNTDTPWIAHYENNPEKKYNLVRPRIAFDKKGTLWISAREFMGKRQEGSKPVVWNYQGDSWSDKKLLLDQQGKRQAVNMAFGKDKGFAVYQFDDLPPGSGPFLGLDINWRSGFGISELSDITESKECITEQLIMPPSSFSLKEKIKSINADLPRQKTVYQGKNLYLFFGDLHSHTDISICRRSWNPTAKDYFDICRDIEKLDFCATTDHGYNFDAAQWDFLGEQVRNNQDDYSFITFLGEEWTSQNNPPRAPKEEQGYGHHNIIFLDPYYRHFYDAFDGDINPKMLWEQLQKDGADFIFIPHQIADMGTNIPVDWKYVNEKFQPVAEIFQGRESYEYLGCPRQAPHGAKFSGHYIQDVWKQGHIIGIIASPDHWGGIGKAAVWAKELTRESLFEAIRARHTYGTTGTKIGLIFQTEQAIMGDKIKLQRNSDLNFKIKALAKSDITEVVIFRNNKIVYREIPNQNEIEIEWEDKKPLKKYSWYYSRVQCADNEIAWSSPIWFLE